jgi:drug/metabolite transporter (DMT)-like permease
MPIGGVGAGLLAALSFGAGDFAGALASRRSGALAAVAGAHGIGLIGLLLALAWIRPALPDMSSIGLGLLAGVAGAAGLAALYRGMSLGTMGLVTALSGVGSLAIPLSAGALLGAQVSGVQLIGVACAAAAGVAASGASRGEMGRQSLALAGVAAVSFGAWYVLIDLAASGGHPLWALVCSRAASAGLAGAVAFKRLRAGRLPLRLVAVAGILDVGGNAFYVIAGDLLGIGLGAALTGLYPIVTMLLARFLIGERLPRLGQVGVGLAFVGVVLISLG